MAPHHRTSEPAGPPGRSVEATPDDPQAPDNSTTRSPLRAVPVLFVLLLAGVVALAISPGLRHQLAQSFTRQSEHYVEFFFTDEDAARTCPLGDDGRLRLEATVRSHLAGAERLGWSAEVRPDGSGSPATDTARGVLETRPDRAARFTARLTVPATSYTATLRLTGRSERLTLHC